MESTFLSVVLSNYAVGIVILVVFLFVIAAALFLAYIVYVWLTIPIGGVFLLNVYMLIIWINPTLNTSSSVIPINWIGIAGFILLIGGSAVCIVLNQMRLQARIDEANDTIAEHEGKLKQAASIVGSRRSDNSR